MKELTDLTQEEKRILCAEACGWSWRSNGFGYRFFAKKGGCGPDTKSPICTDALRRLPRYDTSLDAMATAEATMTEDEKVQAVNHLALVNPSTWQSWFSTAAQRLDAFLIAKGLAN